MTASPLAFELLATDTTTAARQGRLRTPHGVIETPAFMVVGTQGTVKALGPDDLTSIGTQVVLGNTYHLMLRPGGPRVAALGGLHAFMAWPGPILTDSGGFQVFSLSALRTVREEGVAFQSHLDGSKHLLSPETSMAVQRDLGSDMVMAFDECVHLPCTEAQARAACQRTTRWLDRCVTSYNGPGGLFGIIQGGLWESLREEHAKEITARPLAGYAIGGLSVGESKEDMHRVCAFTAGRMPRQAPRYLMGVGTPDDLVRAVAAGVDMFDCVMPTRNARNGTLFTRTGKVVIKNAVHATDKGPLDPSCRCYTCRTFSRGYLRHLFTAQELLSYRLLSLHNVAFFLDLLARVRAALQSGTFSGVLAETLAAYPPKEPGVRGVSGFTPRGPRQNAAGTRR
jgi:queuine tRNA-ribosyltransferase